MVAKHCFKVGMYWQGLTHDLSKYSPSEFWQGCKYYQGYRSPNNAEREDKGYSAAWLHHKGTQQAPTMSTGSITVWGRSKEWQA